MMGLTSLLKEKIFDFYNFEYKFRAHFIKKHRHENKFITLKVK